MFRFKRADQQDDQHAAIRKSPSSYKAKYLLHIQDRIKASLTGITHGKELLHRGRTNPSATSTAESDGESAQSSWHDATTTRLREKLIEEFARQQTQLETLLKYIEEDQTLLRSRLQLVQDQRVLQFTVFAAIFLPLSFTTSLFGMNISPSSAEGPRGFSEWVNSTISEISSEQDRLMTEVLGSITATSGSLNHSWKVFAITAACLLLTLPISMAINAIVRAIVGGVSISAVYWRAGAAIALASLYVIAYVNLLLWEWVWLDLIFLLLTLVPLYLSRKRKLHFSYWAGLVLLFALSFCMNMWVDGVAGRAAATLPWFCTSAGILFMVLKMVRRDRANSWRRRSTISGETR